MGLDIGDEKTNFRQSSEQSSMRSVSYWFVISKWSWGGGPVGAAGAHMSSTARPCDISVLCPVEIFSDDGLDLLGVIFRRRPLSYPLNS
jgi:hypothetical protein